MAKVFLRILLSLYGVAVIGCAVFALANILSDRAPVAELWYGITASMVRPLTPAVAGAVIFTLLHRLGSRRWLEPGGRFLFAFLCMVIGYFYAMFTLWLGFLPVLLFATGVAAWMATRSSADGRLWPEVCLVAGAGVVSGVAETVFVSLL